MGKLDEYKEKASLIGQIMSAIVGILLAILSPVFYLLFFFGVLLAIAAIVKWILGVRIW
jgi:hypothetical protein